MKRLATLMLLIILICTFTACDGEKNNKPKELEKSKHPVNMDVKPLESYGNQLNNLHQANEANVYLFKDANRIYLTEYNQIVRCPIDEPNKKQIIYDFGNEGSYPTNITVMGDWIYFILNEMVSDKLEESNLYRIRIDGSKKTKLAYQVNSYILTEKEIYYEKYSVKSDDSDEITAMKIRVMSLNGKRERGLLKSGTLYGIDNSWIYYESGKEDYALYRMKPDTSKKEKILNLDADSINSTDYCLVEGDYIYSIRNDKLKDGKSFLVEKKNGGEEKILDEGLNYELEDTSALNKDGDWLYYNKKNKIFRVNTNNNNSPELVYSGLDNFVSISLYNEDILATTPDRAFYIKENGAIIKYEY